MLEQILMAVLGACSGAVATVFIIKTMFKPIDLMEDLVDFAVNDTEMQKKLFLLGVLLGNGIKSGIGLNPRGGKFKMEDLIGMALAQFLGPKTGETGLPENPYKKFFSGEK